MADRFTDRVATQPNRYKITPTSGSTYYATLERADEPTELGTPLTAENLNEMLDRNGDTMKGDLAMGGHKVTGLGDAENDTDALALAFAKTLFAPSGYGLGVDAGLNAPYGSANYCTKGSLWVASADCAHSGVWLGITIPGTNKQTQIACAVTNEVGVIAVRTLIDGAGEWEYLNPPMRLGVEYRTTERYNGKAVYRKVVAFGALPANTTKVVAHGISGITLVLQADIRNLSGSASLTNYVSVSDVHGDGTNVTVKTISDISAISANIELKYVKS